MLLCRHPGGQQSKFWFAIDCILSYKSPTVKLSGAFSISRCRSLPFLTQIAMNFSDLARQLNVSTATVSRALSRPEKVAPATRKRVLELVRRSGYHMNGIARSLRTQSTRTIGIIVSDIRNPFSSAIVKSVEDVARTNGYSVLICNADEDGRNEEVALELLIERQVSGVIHCSAGANLDLLRVLLRRNPFRWWISIASRDSRMSIPSYWITNWVRHWQPGICWNWATNELP